MKRYMFVILLAVVFLLEMASATPVWQPQRPTLVRVRVLRIVLSGPLTDCVGRKQV